MSQVGPHVGVTVHSVRCAVRRVFVTDRDEVRADPVLQHVCRTQAAVGIEVRLLYPASVPRVIRASVFDFIVFDNTLSYEVILAAHVELDESPMILKTRLVLRADRVAERIKRHRDIWDSAVPWSDPEPRDPFSFLPATRVSEADRPQRG